MATKAKQATVTDLDAPVSKPKAKKPANVEQGPVSIEAVEAVYARVNLMDIEVIESWNPRRDLGDIGELAQSIRMSGLQTPVRVRAPEREGGSYRLVYGFRRIAACRMAGVTDIPVLIEPADSSEGRLLLLNMQENAARRQLNPMEEASGASRLRAEGLTNEQICQALAWTPTMLTQRLALLDYTEVIREALRDNRITVTQARDIMRLDERHHQKFVSLAEEHQTQKIKELVERQLMLDEEAEEPEVEKVPEPISSADEGDEVEADTVDPAELAGGIRRYLTSVCTTLYDEGPALASQLGRLSNVAWRALPVASLEVLLSFFASLDARVLACMDMDGVSADDDEQSGLPSPIGFDEDDDEGEFEDDDED